MTSIESSAHATFSSAMGDATNYQQWLMEMVAPHLGRSVLEVGVGDGSYRRHLPESADYLGLDIDPRLLAAARATDPRGDYLEADVSDPGLPERLAGRGVDTVLCFNVLEHVAEDERALANLAAAVVPGGHLVVLVPAFPALFNDLDRLAGHLRRYTRAHFARRLPREVEVLRLDYVNPIGGLGWWLNRLRRHESLEDRSVHRQVRLFDRWALPLSRALTPLTHRLFGQSLLLVARRR